jgi:CheY-like chemotaxis protein
MQALKCPRVDGDIPRAVKKGGRMKVLVVEPDETTVKATGVMLNRLGYEVGLATNCDEAFRIYCNQGPYPLVLIDLTFVRGSGAGGVKFIDAMRQKNPQQDYAFVTGSSILRRPFSLQELDDFMGGFRRPAGSRFG